MKSTLVLLAALGLTFGAPAENITDTKDVLRKERSYGPLPCGAAGGFGGGSGFAQGPQFLPQIPQGPPQSQLPQYREHERHQELNARSYYEPSLPALPSASSGAASLGPASLPSPAPSSGGSAVGLFPNAKVGGCNVPLLLSCSPQIVTGHLAESHAAPAAASYKHAEETMKTNMGPHHARVASHHKVSEDYPEPQDPHPGNHHKISQDYPQPNLAVYLPRPQQEIKKGQDLDKTL